MMTTQEPVQRRLFVSMLVTLDGYIEGPERELDWFEDGDTQFEEYCDEMIDSVGLAVYGRRAYELMLGYWPNAEVNPRSPADLAFARKMNALPKVVLSRTLEHAAWNNTRIVRDGVAETITALKREPGKPIVAWAGAGLVSTLTRLGLVDDPELAARRHRVACVHGEVHEHPTRPPSSSAIRVLSTAGAAAAQRGGRARQAWAG